MKNCIAERQLMFAPKGSSERRMFAIRIGTPYWVDNDEARCPVELDGLPLKEKISDAPGMDLMQALELAINIDSLLRKLRNKYDFYWPTGEPYFD